MNDQIRHTGCSTFIDMPGRIQGKSLKGDERGRERAGHEQQDPS
ncbi:hypothetical protein AB6813_21905 [bacterium RCC_150]